MPLDQRLPVLIVLLDTLVLLPQIHQQLAQLALILCWVLLLVQHVQQAIIAHQLIKVQFNALVLEVSNMQKQDQLLAVSVQQVTLAQISTQLPLLALLATILLLEIQLALDAQLAVLAQLPLKVQLLVTPEHMLSLAQQVV